MFTAGENVDYIKILEKWQKLYFCTINLGIM